jgi:hypothetical protein
MIARRTIESACWAIWPLPLAVLVYFLAPEVSLWFVRPLLNLGNPYVCLELLAATLWLLLGFFVVYKFSKWWQRMIATVIFPLPVLCLSMLAPALITLFGALSSIVQNK